ncbi:hypothetical protein WA158_000624 [Blastocystis sp. Blastoise]
MSSAELHLSEYKYLFTFQDETQLWIPREFIEKYQQLPFYDIIDHSEKYDDGSYYIDMPSLSMKKVISFYNDENRDISSLNLKDSYDIYKTFVEYSVTIDKEIQSDLLFHVKDYTDKKQLTIPMELFNSENKILHINGLITSLQRDLLLYYSVFFKMMNVTQVYLKYEYASNIPLEYICPSCIKDIFPLLKELIIRVNTHYEQTELLLNPNSDEYIMEYTCLYYNDDYETNKPEECDYYSESEMNEYYKISSLDTNDAYLSHDLIHSYNKRRKNNHLPKLYKLNINEAIYTNDYSKVKNSEMVCNNMLKDIVRITFDNKINNELFHIDKLSSTCGMFQLLQLFSHLSISDIGCNMFLSNSKYEAMVIIKSLEEGAFDSLTRLSVQWINKLADKIDKNLFNKIMATHIFPNVTELIYDDTYKYFELLFPMDLISIIDTIKIKKIDDNQKEEIAYLLYNLVYTHSIHVDVFSENFSIDTSNSEKNEKLDSFENYKRNINCLDITFRDIMKNDMRNSLERFFKSSVLECLNDLTISLRYIRKNSSSEYFTILENIMNKIIPKTSIITIKVINDIPDEDFCELYTTDNFPKLESIMFNNYHEDWMNDFIQKLCIYINNSIFPLSSTIQLTKCRYFYYNSDDHYVYDPNTSILRCKYDTNSFIDTIIGNKDIYDEEQFSNLINFITTGKFPKLKYIFFYCYDISFEQIEIYKQQFKDSSFIQENYVNYSFD